MYRDALLDELRQVGRDVVEGERQLAELEALLVALKRQGKDVSKLRLPWSRCAQIIAYVSKTVNAFFRDCSLSKGNNRICSH